MWHLWRCMLRVAGSKQGVIPAFLLVGVMAFCRNEPSVMCSQPVASVQGENVF